LTRWRFVYVAAIAVARGPELDRVALVIRTVIVNGTDSPRGRSLPAQSSGA
jgi:hypothetical protein